MYADKLDGHSSALASPAKRRFAIPASAKNPANFLPASAWLFLFYMQVLSVDFPPALPNLMIAFVQLICFSLFVMRAEPSRTSGRWDMALALAGTFVTSFMPQATDVTFLSTVIQVAGLAAWSWSLLALGRSIGIAPADRGLKVKGPYSLVRHPVYASELLFTIGVAISAPGLRTVTILVIWWVLQVARIFREERVLDGYGPYRANVRWRVLPGVW